MNHPESSLTDDDLARLERDTFKYFAEEMQPENGLVPDSTRQGAPSSIAAVDLALTAYPIAVERRYLSRSEAIKRTLTKLRFFHSAPQGPGKNDALGYHGHSSITLNLSPMDVPPEARLLLHIPQVSSCFDTLTVARITNRS